MPYTINNTKSIGRKTARRMAADGMSASALRENATVFLLYPEDYRNRHVVHGFASEVARITCWNDFCDNPRHADDLHSDVTGHTWTQARDTRYCPACGDYTACGHK